MIAQIKGTKNGYQLDQNSTAYQWNELFEAQDNIRCLICNARTATKFRPGILTPNIITINNKIPDDAVYFNGVW